MLLARWPLRHVVWLLTGCGKTIFQASPKLDLESSQDVEEEQDAQKGLQQGPRERSPRSVLLVREEASRPRTPLVDFFSILLMVCLVFVSACSKTEPPKPGSGSDGLTQLNPAEANDAWLIAVQKRIYEIWRNNAPKGLPGKVVAGVTVQSDGQLLDIAILESSGVVALDEYALEAIRTAAPFPRFPPSMTEEFKSFRTRFDYGEKPEE